MSFDQTPACSPDVIALVEPSRRHRMGARLLAPALDKRIAAGEFVDADRLLVERARRLISLRYRSELSNQLEQATRDFRRQLPGRWRFGLGDPRIGVDGDAVATAAPELDALIADLRSAGPVEARGVALAQRLLTDGGGPLYAGPAARLTLAARDADDALHPLPPVGETRRRAFGIR